MKILTHIPTTQYSYIEFLYDTDDVSGKQQEEFSKVLEANLKMNALVGSAKIEMSKKKLNSPPPSGN